MHSIGSKAALSILPAALINPGDYAIMTTPGYPVFGTHSKYYGGLVHNLPLNAGNNFLPELETIPGEVLAKAKALVLNYPNNPARRGLRGAGVQRQAVELPLDPGCEGRGGGTSLHEQIVQHDRMALRLRGRKPVAGQSLRGCEGQYGLGTVPGHSTRGGLLPGSSGHHRADRGEVLAADGRPGGGAAVGGIQRRETGGLVFPLRQIAQSGGQTGWFARGVQERRGGLAVADHREAHLDRPLGRRGGVAPV